MKFTHAHRFAATVEAVTAMLADESFAHARARSSGAETIDAVVDGDATGEFTVFIRRVVPARTIPSEFRSLVGDTLDVKYTEAWEAPGEAERVGTFAVEIAGAPVRVAGALELKDADGGTEFFAAGQATAPVPLFGAIIEKSVTDAVVSAFKDELTRGDRWLAGETSL
ncbi:MAG: DUF2505 domain-containing protein [Demequina sp.]